MDFISLKLWHWMIAGLLGGALVGFAWCGAPTYNVPRSAGAQDFTRIIDATFPIPTAAGAPQPRRWGQRVPPGTKMGAITVYSPETDPSGVKIFPVFYSVSEPADRTKPDGKLISTDHTLNARTPFGRDADILAYLTAHKVPFANRTGKGEYVPVYYGAAIGVTAIGILWPLLIQLMIRAGMVPKPLPKEKKVKAAPRTGEDVDEMLVKPDDKSVKAADVAKLDALNADMEQKLGAGLIASGPRKPGASTEEPVSVLMSGAGSRSTIDPTLAPAPHAEAEKKDYEGQYYPVVRTHKKDDEEKK